MQAYQFSAYAIPPAVTAVAVMIFALVVVLRRPSRTGNAIFGVCVAAAVWQVTRVFMYLTLDPKTAVLWARVGLGAVIFIAPSVYLFIDTILPSTRHRRIISVLTRVIA